MSGEATAWLERWREGDPRALAGVVDELYWQLRSLARSLMAEERHQLTLTPTALLHEAYLRLSGDRKVDAANRQAFFAVAATAMRRVLVDAARRRLAAKRGGDWVEVELGEWLPEESADLEELIRVDEVLDDLERRSQRARRVVELKVFAGLTFDEMAEALGVNERTVRRDWDLAQAWLRRELGSGLRSG